MKKIVTFILFWGIFLISSSFAERVSPFLTNSKQCAIITNDKKTGKQISRMTVEVQKKEFHDGILFMIHNQGSGSIYDYKEARWDVTAEMKIDEGFIKPIHTSIIIKDKDGNFLEKCLKSFDYSNKQIIWEYYGKNQTLKKQKIFPMKGRTCDDVTLIYFLKPYLTEEKRKELQYFYLITNEPQLFKTKITYFENETLSLPSGNIEAIKLKLTGDMGIVDDLLDKYVPHTYVWYAQKNPHLWLKYEGLEKNLHSRYIESFVDLQ